MKARLLLIVILLLLSGASAFRVDNNEPPKIVLTDITTEQVADVTVAYEISDREGDPISLKPEFSRDSGKTWEPATVTGQTEAIQSSGYRSTLVWNSKSDTDKLDLFEVQFRLTPSDNDVGTLDATANFQVDNSDIPSIVLTDITTEQVADVTIAYEISDREGDTISLKPEFSRDSGKTWEPATVTGQTEAIQSSGYRSTLTWNSKSDTDKLDLFEVQFRLTPSDNDVGTLDATANFQVDNSDIPSIVLTDITTEQVADVTVAYEISDREGDPISIKPEFSRDSGKTWEPATVTGQTEAIQSSSYRSTLTWNSKSDTDMLDLFEVQFRLTPSDNDVGTLDATANFQVDNSDIPSIVLTDITTEQVADVTVAYEISDREGDPISLKPEFSRDSGKTWEPATVTGQTEAIQSSGYRSTLTWNSKSDTDKLDLFEVQFRLTPSDNDVGTLDATANFQVDNSDIPSIVLTDITTEQVADVTVAYEISDREDDPISIKPEFSRDSGKTWEPAAVTGQTEAIQSSGYRSTLVWNSKSDTDKLDLFEVQFRLTPSDNDVGTLDSTANFQVDNSDIPSIVLTDITTEQVADVTIAYEISDREGDPISLKPEFSRDSGKTWEPATVTGQTEAIQSSGYRSTLTWNSKSDTDMLDLFEVQFRLTPSDNDVGTLDATANFQVDNSDIPSIVLTDITTEQVADVTVAYEISDREGDPISLKPEFSRDSGKTWEPATVTGQTEAIQSSGYRSTLTWNSKSDTDKLDLFEVQFRLTPSDNDVGTLDATANFQVDNSDIPSIVLTDITTEQVADVTVAYEISDREGDPISLKPEFSRDSGKTWEPATVTGQTEAIQSSGYRSTLTWNSKSDTDMLDLFEVQFRLTPSDNDVGTLDATANFQVDNSDIPSIVLTDITTEQVADVTIAYEISDREGDPISIKPEFSRDSGKTWEPATVTGQTEAIHSSGYRSTLTWNSKSDTDKLDLFEVQFRLTPSDNDVGTLDATANFQVDNSDIPSIVLTDITTEQVADVTVAYEISDREGDPISLKPEFSRDSGKTWEPATVTGQTEAIQSSGYRSTLTWNSKSDTDMLDLFEVQFRLTPSDNDVGTLDATANFQVDNSDIPSVVLTDITTEQVADVTVAYEISDREGDPISLEPEFSRDSGKTWEPATVTGQTEAIQSSGYRSTLTWNSKSDTDKLDLFEVQFRLTPSDNDVGTLDATANFQVDNSDIPSIVLTDITTEQVADVTVAYEISDREGDPISLEPEFSRDSGKTWEPATVTGQTEAIQSSGYRSTLTWNSKSDTDKLDLFEVQFRLTPSDNDVGTLDATANFQVDNSDIPSIVLTDITTEQVADVTVAYEISDREGDPISLKPEFSRDSGKTWEPATVTGQTEAIQSSGYRSTLVWNSKSDTDKLDLFEVQFRLTPSDNDVGTLDATANFQVDNSDIPSIVLTDITTEQVADVTVAYEISDREGDPISLKPEFSRDSGKTWEPAAVTGQTEAIQSSGYRSTLVWNSKSDTDKLDLFEVQFRLTPSDNDVGTLDATANFQVDNSDIPSIVLTDITTEQVADVTVAYEISDREGDPISIKPEFSRDSGKTWEPATVTGQTEAIQSSGYRSTLVWNSKSDTDKLDLFEVQFRLTPSDNDVGTLDATANFQVDNSDIPSIVLTDITTEQVADVTIAYEISDREGDPISLKPEFSRDSGKTWEPATVTGQTEAIQSSSYRSTLTWNSKSDTDKLDLFEVQFRLTPSDNDVGTLDATANFQVDNSDIPSIVLTDITTEQVADVTVAYEISDREGDPISLKPEFSRDSGKTWEPATVTGQTEAIQSSGYRSTLTWNSKSDTDMLDLFEVQFRLTPSDNDVGTLDATANFQVDDSDVPAITLTTPSGEQTNDVVIAYNLTDREGDPISLVPEYSADGGSTWKAATVSGAVEGVKPGSGSLTWNSKSDVDELDGNYLFRITPSDNDTGETGQTTAFQVDNSDVPRISLDSVTGELAAEVTISFNLEDREGDPCSLKAEFSTDGSTWKPANVTGQTEGVKPGRGQLKWNSAGDLDRADLEKVYFRITPSDNDTGEPAQTGPFRLDNSEPPLIDMDTPSGEQSGAVSIGYNVSDREGDAVSLVVEYSLDGGSSWKPATVTEATSGIKPGKGKLTWRSDTDAPGVDVNAAMLRATPSDNDEGTSGQTGIFPLDNDKPPTAMVTVPSGTLTGPVAVTVTPKDPEGDPVDCDLEYDAGAGWTPASYTGKLSGITGSVTVTWDAPGQLGAIAASGKLRVIPADNDTGEPSETSFSVDNTPAPPPEPEPTPEPTPTP